MAENKEKSKAKRIISVIFTIISALIFVLVALILINMIVCRSQNKPINIFGYSFSVVQTGSMEPDIMVGDLIVFKKVDYSTFKEGDFIVFKADENFKDGAGNSLQGYTIVHKIVEVTADGIRTQGVNNNGLVDGGFRTEDEVYGLCISNSAGWGKVFTFLSQYGVLIIIFIIAVPVIVTQTIKIVKLSKKKKVEGAEEVKDVPLEESNAQNGENNSTSVQTIAESGESTALNDESGKSAEE